MVSFAFVSSLPLSVRTRRAQICKRAVTSIRMSAPPTSTDLPPRLDKESLTERAINLAREWASKTNDPPSREDLVASLSADPSAVPFVMQFTDFVMRPNDMNVAARLLSAILASTPIPSFFQAIDAAMLRLASIFAPILPMPVIIAARLRMRLLVAPFVGIVESMKLDGRLQRNVNLLGEAVLGEEEAKRRRDEAEMLLAREGVDYVSVKVSGVTSQLNRWDFEGSLDRVLKSLRPLFQRAKESRPRVLINLDMEEYHDLELTLEAFMKLLEEEEFQELDAGIVLQTYLPDAFPALQKLVEWANSREGVAEIKIRLVKGANLAMEKVDAALHGWKQAPYETKAEVDANYLRCLDWVLTPERLGRVRIGVASHNLFLLAYAHELSRERGVAHRVGFEMLQGMTPRHTPFLSRQGHGMLLYTPVCRLKDFDVSISYLFRRFEETSADGNFLRSLSSFAPGSMSFRLEEARFRNAAQQTSVGVGARREQIRPAPASAMTLDEGTVFFNEPDTDPSLPPNRKWAMEVLKGEHFNGKIAESSRIQSIEEARELVNSTRAAGAEWGRRSRKERRATLVAIADVLARRRGDLINAMVHEGGKTFAEADSEVSEAIDFAQYYGMICEKLPDGFEPFGVVMVAAPWNFPVAISSGGVLAALAAGNGVILKPSSVTKRCGELVAECAWEAGVPKDVLRFVQTPAREVGKELVTSADAVILTGSTETANLFRSWKNDLRLFAETSGKNSMIITPAADIDLAVADLAQSAFTNSGQKCSASSLAICVGEVYRSPRFRRQLQDAVQSLKVGSSDDVSTIMGPLAMPPGDKLLRALTKLEAGEEWLVKPEKLDAEGKLWTPGVRMGVKEGSWFHMTEAFGPVLGVMYARDLDEALRLQNATEYGLTGGVHTLDKAEIAYWMERVQVGNAYVNKPTTGAIVQRQSFGGWKGSVVGPGAKAGGPNYVMQFGNVRDESVKDEAWLRAATEGDEKVWNEVFGKEHDPTGLFCESNVLRYRALPLVVVRVGEGSSIFEVERVRAAIEKCGVEKVIWSDWEKESAAEFARKLAKMNVPRVRVIGKVEEEVLRVAARNNVYVGGGDVVGNGRVEMLHYLREQAVSWTRHRFGNLVTG